MSPVIADRVVLERYLNAPAWETQVKQVYKRRSDSLELEKKSDPGMAAEIDGILAGLGKTKEPVIGLGVVMRSENSKFIPALQKILNQDPAHIPAPMKMLLGEMIVWRERAMPAALEKDAGMQTALKKVFDDARLHFSGAPKRAATANSAAGIYMEAYRERETAAQKHVSGINPTASGKQIVTWCEALIKFTRQELGAVRLSAVESLEKAATRLEKSDPAAANVVKETADYLQNGIFKNTFNAADGVKHAITACNSANRTAITHTAAYHQPPPQAAALGARPRL